ncbi:MAG: hypothetical protein IT161_19670 [Bryobacterales bacterium]|nr:hypothetical protein [Bryobacterales bacterium]
MTWKDGELDSAFSELRAEDPPAAAMAAVRARVLEQVARRKRVWPKIWIALAGAAAVVVLAITVRSPAWEPVASLPAPVLAAPPAPPDAVVARHVMRTPAHLVTPRPVRRAVMSDEFVHLMTDDPDVVILWAVDSKGDTE